jgi:hypothetical protein
MVIARSMWVVCVFLLLGPASSALAQEGAFTGTERARLARGEIVTRRTTEQRGGLRLIGGTSWQVIDAPPSAVWEAALDTPRYNHLFPEVDDARVVERASNRRVVRLHHERGPIELDYHLELTFLDSQRLARFRVDPTRPHAIRDAWGFFSIRPYAGGKSIVTWGILADVGTGLVTGLLRPTVHEWMLLVPRTMKRFIEGSGRPRYLHEGA